MHAVADAADHTLLEVSAVPHALPWNECPAAGEMVGKLVGTSARRSALGGAEGVAGNRELHPPHRTSSASSPTSRTSPASLAHALMAPSEDVPPRFPGQRFPLPEDGGPSDVDGSPHAARPRGARPRPLPRRRTRRRRSCPTVRRAGRGAGRARREPHGAGRALPPLAARLLPPPRTAPTGRRSSGSTAIATGDRSRLGT